LRPRIQINHYGIFDGLTAGTYTVSIRNANDCQLDTVVTVGEDPMNFFLSTSHHDLGCTGWGYEGSAEVFTQGGVSPFTYLWNTSPVQTGSKITDLYYGWYIVSVTDATGCTLKDTVQILPGNCCEEIFIPSAFTPNGDGINDEWKLVTSTGMALKEFAVYNRWGQRVWNTSDQRNSWKGLYQNRDAEAGTYYYILRYTCLTDQKEYTRRGDVMLIR
jgi:gliding motility-associated-like protein